jgi:sRNA-binding carbon storage regulator CsrA
MLLISRRKDESIMVGDDFRLTAQDVAVSTPLIAVTRQGLGGRMSTLDEVARQWVFSRQPIAFGEAFSVELVDVRGDNVRLGLVAPRNWVHRREVYEALQKGVPGSRSPRTRPDGCTMTSPRPWSSSSAKRPSP